MILFDHCSRPPSRLGSVPSHEEWGGDTPPLSIPRPSRRLRHLDPRRLGCLEPAPHFSDQSFAPGWAPGLPPAKSGPALSYVHGTDRQTDRLTDGSQRCLLPEP